MRQEREGSSVAERRILYLQYTNPAAYPPLEHSSRILADAGWRVRFLGIAGGGLDAMEFPPHPGIEVVRLPGCAPGVRQKVHYLRFLLRCLREALRWRPQWVYASDTLSTPAARLIQAIPGVRVLYHEHDTPSEVAGSPLLRLALAARRRMIPRAELLVLPNAERARRVAAAHRVEQKVEVVWNCPRIDEVSGPRPPLEGTLRVLYHGTLVPERLPLSILGALRRAGEGVELVVVGYETLGAPGYAQALRDEAHRLGVAARFHLLGPLPRHRLLEVCRGCDVGLAFMPAASDDINMREMVGASNKVFDYLAGGVAPLVSNLSEWREHFVRPGYALECDPRDEESVAAALRWLRANPAAVREMGERGRCQILRAWNYEAQFAPVLARLGAGGLI